MIARLGRLLALAALLALYAAILAGRIEAQARPTTNVALARVCVAEAGWDVTSGDCAAIVHLLERRADAQGIPVRRMAELYASRHFDPERTDRRRWIVGLTIEARRPAGWPSGVPWRAFRPAWLSTIAHVDAVRRGDVADPCPGADHWGGPMDDHRAIHAGWERVECAAETRNRFWLVPRGDAS